MGVYISGGSVTIKKIIKNNLLSETFDYLS